MLELIQGNKKSSAGFLEFLHEVFGEYTPFNPPGPENQQAINISCVTQLASDVCTKLQKV